MPEKQDEAAFTAEGLMFVPPAAGQDADGDGVPDSAPQLAGLSAESLTSVVQAMRGQAPQAEMPDHEGLIYAPAAPSAPSQQEVTATAAQALATMQAMAEDIAMTEEMTKKFTINFDRADFATGTGPKYDEASLANMRTGLLQLDGALNATSANLQALRERGYIFDGSLDREIPLLNQQWDQTMPRVMDEVLRRGQELTAESVRVGRQFPWDGSGVEPPEHSRAVWELSSKIGSAESGIRGMYSGLETRIRDVETRLEKAKYLMDKLAEASFKLQPDEYPVAVCAARYLTGTGDEEGPNGYLFLTDQRLIFEQNEDIAKAKVLFLTTKKEHVQGVKLDAPIGTVIKIEAEDKGFMSHKDFLNLRFQEPPAPRPGARFHIQDDNQRWVALINKITSGGIDAERVGAKSVAERVAAEQAGGPAAEAKPQIPTHCPSCGAPIHAKPVRGMTSITCEFCGIQIRV